MSLKDDIEILKKERKLTKSEKIAEYRDDILEMLALRTPLNKQIELLIKNQIVDKITITEYRRILEMDFGYEGRNRKVKKQTPQAEQPKEQIKTTPLSQTKRPNPAQNVKDILSQEFTLEV